jgi:hypothetical protein
MTWSAAAKDDGSAIPSTSAIFVFCAASAFYGLAVTFFLTCLYVAFLLEILRLGGPLPLFYT